MNTTIRRAVTVLAVVLTTPATRAQPESDAFQALKNLVGHWEGT